MDKAIKGIEQTALRHSRKAVRLWEECRHVMELADRENFVAAIFAAARLNAEAIEECRQAINKLDFVNRYHTPHGDRSESSGRPTQH